MRQCAVIFLFLLFVSCNLPTSNPDQEVSIEKKELPDQIADTIHVVYSEEGQIKFELLAPELVMHDTNIDQYNEFPEGVKILFYDKSGIQNADLKANYGYDNPRNQTRYVKDSVIITSKADGMVYSTSELYIDEKADSIHNKGKYVKITLPDGTFLQGHGFVSNSRMDKITIKNMFDSTLPIDENKLNSEPTGIDGPALDASEIK